MIDIHCHLLPGIDDGPATLDAALALARMLAEDGVTRAVCTPHVFPGRFENWRTSIAEDHARFAAAVQAAGIELELHWAGEVRLTPEVLDLLTRDELPFLGMVAGHRTMLLEMPDGQVPLGAGHFVRRLIAANVRPVIVHPERNRGVMEKPDRLREFIDLGCYVQLTAGSLVGQFGDRAKAVASQLVARGWAHALASDAHNTGARRPRMREAADWVVRHHGEALARQLTVLGPAGLCEGNSVVNSRAQASVAPAAPGSRRAPPGLGDANAEKRPLSG